MDLWLIASTAATGYITKHLHNASKGKVNSLESCSEDLNTVKLESPRCLASEFVRLKKPKRENFGGCVNEEDLDLFECGNAYGVEVDSSNEEDLGNNDEIPSDSLCNRAFLRRNQRYTSLIKPFSTEKSVMSQLHREKMSMEEYMLSPFPSPCGSVSRPLLVTDGNKVISKNTGGFTSQRVLNCGSPQLRKLESSVLYVKRRAGTEKSASRRSDNGIGSYDAVWLLCVGISIGIMSSFVANKAKAEIKQTENLVKDLEDELKTKDALTEKDDLQNGEKQCDEKTAEKSESISKIEAELEAELERLEINMTFSNIETRLSDVFELEPDFEVEFAQGELRDDLVGMQRFNETTESNKEPSGNATPESGYYTVSPRELSLRVHKVINSRNEERIKELEIALQESQRKAEQLVMEAEEKKKPVSRFWESHDEVMKHRRDSNRPVSVAHNEKKHKPAETQPLVLVMSLAGEALDAFNESYEELMDINDYSEDDELPFKMQDQQEELSLTSKSSPWSHRDDIKGSSRTSEDVSFLRLQDLLGLSDKEEEEEDGEFESEMEKQLIKQIVEKAKQGSSAVLNAQKMLFLMEEIET
uniref:Protein POLAR LOCALIZATION DURING ASYMMETRIC DIVISION AND REDISTRIBUTION n=1 Tax=Noccaea caerulescens TaxID=107243 RepID=A0A1J3DFZ0_NOCCA